MGDEDEQRRRGPLQTRLADRDEEDLRQIAREEGTTVAAVLRRGALAELRRWRGRRRE